MVSEHKEADLPSPELWVCQTSRRQSAVPHMYLEQCATHQKSHRGWPVDLLTEGRPGKEPQDYRLGGSQGEISRPMGSKRVTWELVKNANAQLHP